MMVKQIIFNFQNTNKELLKEGFITAQNDAKLNNLSALACQATYFKQLNNFCI